MALQLGHVRHLIYYPLCVVIDIYIVRVGGKDLCVFRQSK